MCVTSSRCAYVVDVWCGKAVDVAPRPLDDVQEVLCMSTRVSNAASQLQQSRAECLVVAIKQLRNMEEDYDFHAELIGRTLHQPDLLAPSASTSLSVSPPIAPCPLSPPQITKSPPVVSFGKFTQFSPTTAQSIKVSSVPMWHHRSNGRFTVKPILHMAPRPLQPSSPF